MSLVGQTVGRYEILEAVGEGGMAMVYKASDTRLEREVAVKVIRREVFPPNRLEHILQRFEREAKSLARLSHPNIVEVIDYGDHEGSPYLVMPYLSGGTLKQQMGQVMPWEQAVRLLLPVARGLAYAQGRGIVHRDIKPSNILITESGEPVLTDFGVAKLLEQEDGQTLTGTGVGVGTPEYMAPEQWTNQAVPQSDMYGLGVVLYELVTGRKPYQADTPAALLLKQATEPLPRPGMLNPAVPARLEEVLLKMLARDPADRYSGMDELVVVLEGLLGPVEKLPGLLAGSGQVKGEEADRTMDDLIPARPKRVFPVRRLAVITMIALLGGLLGMGVFWMNLFPILLTEVVETATNLPASSTPPAILTPGPEPVALQTRSVDGMVMVYVPEGSFEMGSEQGDPNERPVHTVTLDGFWIDRTEVTNAMFAKFVRDTGYRTDAEVTGQSVMYQEGEWGWVAYADWQHPFGPESSLEGLMDHPVVHVSWQDASSYCGWADSRLPSEAEWELAARGTEGRIYPWGNARPSCLFANFEGCQVSPVSVGGYPAGSSPYGVLDLAGNVWEVVSDWFNPDYYVRSPERNPEGPESGNHRVMRGGSWFHGEGSLRAAAREVVAPNHSSGEIGFRCARSDP